MHSEKAKTKEVKKLLSALISQNTENPPGNEYKTASVIKWFLKKYKIAFKEFEKEKGRTNLIAYIGEWNKKPDLMIVVHSDVVPAGEGWKTNPFKAIEKSGKIFGRGAEDDKGPAVAALLAIKELKNKIKEIKLQKKEIKLQKKVMKRTEEELKEERNELNGSFSVALLADEEKGSINGMDFLLEKKLISPKYAIVLDNGSGLKEITIGEKARLHLKIIAKGKQAHGSMPEKGINAINSMAEFLVSLKRIKLKGKKMKLFSPSTINVGKIKGGIATNVVPGKCQATLDIRYLPNQNWRKITKEIKKIAKETEKKTKAIFKIKVIAKDIPWVTNSENILVKKLKEKTKQVTGKEPKITGLSGATDARKLVKKRCITVGFGIGNETAHKANEFIELKQILQLAEIIELVAMDLLEEK